MLALQQHLFNCREERLQLKGFLKRPIGAQLPSKFEIHARHRRPRHRDDSQFREAPPRGDDRFDPFLSGHDNVSDNEVDPGALQLRQACRSITGLDDRMPGVGQRQTDHPAKIVVVLDD